MVIAVSEELVPELNVRECLVLSMELDDLFKPVSVHRTDPERI